METSSLEIGSPIPIPYRIEFEVYLYTAEISLR